VGCLSVTNKLRQGTQELISKTVDEMLVSVDVFAAPADQIKTAVVDGQRPRLEDIRGPKDFEVFVRNCVEKCWSGEPEQRPTFGGESLLQCFAFIW